MRLEIGSDGKIIGTRRVSPNGQVSGLTEFAGREVLVILPGSGNSDSALTWASPEAVAQAVGEQMRQAYERYELLQKLYATPWEATRSFVRSAFGSSTPDLVGEVDRWVKNQLRSAAPDQAMKSDSPATRKTSETPAKESRARAKRRIAQT